MDANLGVIFRVLDFSRIGEILAIWRALLCGCYICILITCSVSVVDKEGSAVILPTLKSKCSSIHTIKQ